MHIVAADGFLEGQDRRKARRPLCNRTATLRWDGRVERSCVFDGSFILLRLAVKLARVTVDCWNNVFPFPNCG